MLLRLVSLLQDVDATAGLTLKVKQEPFSASGELIRGKYRPFFLNCFPGCAKNRRAVVASALWKEGRVTHIN